MEFMRLKASKRLNDNRISYNSERVVLLLIKNKATPFTTHLEIFPKDEKTNNGKPYLLHGEYCTTLEAAERSFKYRMAKSYLSEDKKFEPDMEWNGEED